MHYGPMMIDLKGISLTSEERGLLQHPGVGGVLLFSRNYTTKEALKALVEEIRGVAGRPLLIAADHEGGRVWRFREGFTKLPAAREYGLLYQTEPKECLAKAREAGALMAAELLECNIDLSLAPVLDVDSGLSEVIGDRAFHSDPLAVAALAGAFIEGMNKRGMAATGKHFPGHGGSKADSHFSEVIDSRTLDILMSQDMIPFEKLCGKLGAMMPAHVIYPAIDSVPACYSRIWLKDILRGKLGFEGVIISDCLSMKGAASLGGDFVVRTRMALDAGCDMVILCQQERSLLQWVLDKLDRTVSTDTHKRLAGLAGKFSIGENKGSHLTHLARIE